MINAPVVIVLLVLLSAVVWMIRRVSKRGNDLMLLRERGQNIVGTLVEARAERRSRTNKNHYIKYSFRPGGATEYCRQLRVSESEFSDYEQGQEIEVVFLAEDPNVNALKKLVNQIPNRPGTSGNH